MDCPMPAGCDGRRVAMESPADTLWQRHPSLDMLLPGIKDDSSVDGDKAMPARDFAEELDMYPRTYITALDNGHAEDASALQKQYSWPEYRVVYDTTPRITVAESRSIFRKRRDADPQSRLFVVDSKVYIGDDNVTASTFLDTEVLEWHGRMRRRGVLVFKWRWSVMRKKWLVHELVMCKGPPDDWTWHR
ncbi:hypothetical protein BDY17DRAFT_305439 [Neohortaea acidophila]|uniref:Uncharacterized protein n=1 Tax=Neohortaea acidophila TaxID=245834 RepID=A0A6A6PF18_9PEZI|nr:uncharacterized protein BDY17DRAFT_305439 [Neohortaea acidophila]KAF2478579.1 hypothetical protein BDY17DRAFT_305439 [Neohortaea acidophila]